MSDDGQIDFDEFVRQHTHRKDPDTSREAARDQIASGRSTRNKAKIYKVLEEAGEPLAPEQIGDRLPELDQAEIRRRCSDLTTKDKVVRRSPHRHQNRSGKFAYKLELVG